MPTRTEDVVNPDVGPPATADPAGQATVRRRRAIWWFWPPLAILAMAGALVWFSLWSQHVPLGNSLFNHPPLYGKFGPVYTDWTLIRLIPAGLLLAIAAWVAVATGAGARPVGAPPPRTRVRDDAAAAPAADAAAGEPASRRTRTVAMLMLIIASAWVTSIAVNLIRGDQQALVKGVSTTQGTYFSRDLHYIDELGVRGFVSSFPSIVDNFVVWNARTHPPGVQVFLWTVSKLVHAQPYAMTTVLAIVSMCTAIGAWGMARAYGGERAGRIAAVLAVAAPGPLMLAYTNMDAVFAAFFAGAAAFLVVGARRRSAVFAAIGGAVLGLATFLTYATAFLALAAGIAIVVETRSFKQSVKVLGAAIAGGLAVLLVLRLTLGFDLLACYAALTRSGAKFVPYWVAGQPAAWLIWAGLPMAALGIGGLIVKVPGARRPVLPALLIVLMIIWGALPPSMTGLRQGEVERTWAFLYPMLAASAGPVIDFWTRGYRPVARAWAGGVVALLVALSVAQAGVVQSLWDNLT